jgi:hypothetical protein
MNTHHRRFITEGVAETSEILIRGTRILLKRNEKSCNRDAW